MIVLVFKKRQQTHGFAFEPALDVAAFNEVGEKRQRLFPRGVKRRVVGGSRTSLWGQAAAPIAPRFPRLGNYLRPARCPRAGLRVDELPGPEEFQ